MPDLGTIVTDQWPGKRAEGYFGFTCYSLAPFPPSLRGEGTGRVYILSAQNFKPR